MDGAEAAWEIAEHVRRGEWRARDVVAAALERIDAQNPALNAFTAVDRDGALRAAELMDARVARGEDPGALAGVPIGVKDLEAVAGLPWTMGSRLYAERVAKDDSVQVGRLRAAGAIVVGKTNTPEFGYKGFTINKLYGATRNPWDPARTPGGSSGGSGVAVAAGMVPVCTGSDGGGSIRIPSAFCGTFGLKPSCGRIPRGGPEPSHWTFLSHLGPITWSVRDAARYLDAAAGPDPTDLDALDAPSGGYEAALGEPLQLRRIAWSADLGYAAADSAVRAVAESAARALAEATGAELVEAHPGFEDPLQTWLVLATSGDLAATQGWSEEQKALVERGYLQFAEVGLNFLAMDYARALGARHALNYQLARFFQQHDLLLTPTLPITAFQAEGPPPAVIDGREVGPTGYIPFTFPFNITGHPAASVPAGLPPDGLPVGLQIVGPRYADALVLRASVAFERARPWQRPGG